jgi:hypothetical protein
MFHSFDNTNLCQSSINRTYTIIYKLSMLKPHCIRCSHFKVDDISALEASSTPPVRIVEDSVTASLHQQRTQCGYGLDAVTT